MSCGFVLFRVSANMGKPIKEWCWLIHTFVKTQVCSPVLCFHCVFLMLILVAVPVPSDCLCAPGTPVCATVLGIGQVSLGSVCTARCKGFDVNKIVEGSCAEDTFEGGFGTSNFLSCFGLET